MSGRGGGVMGWESIALMHLCTYVLFFAVRYVAKPGCDVQVTVTCCLNRDMGTNHTWTFLNFSHIFDRWNKLFYISKFIEPKTNVSITLKISTSRREARVGLVWDFSLRNHASSWHIVYSSIAMIFFFSPSWFILTVTMREVFCVGYIPRVWDPRSLSLRQIVYFLSKQFNLNDHKNKKKNSLMCFSSQPQSEARLQTRIRYHFRAINLPVKISQSRDFPENPLFYLLI